MFYPSLVMAILAAVVASQALITSTFQLLSQVMHGSYAPHIDLRYTSEKHYGQVYIPLANWLMMIGTVIVTAVYSNVSSPDRRGPTGDADDRSRLLSLATPMECASFSSPSSRPTL